MYVRTSVCGAIYGTLEPKGENLTGIVGCTVVDESLMHGDLAYSFETLCICSGLVGKWNTATSVTSDDRLTALWDTEAPWERSLSIAAYLHIHIHRLER